MVGVKGWWRWVQFLPSPLGGRVQNWAKICFCIWKQKNFGQKLMFLQLCGSNLAGAHQYKCSSKSLDWNNTCVTSAEKRDCLNGAKPLQKRFSQIQSTRPKNRKSGLTFTRTRVCLRGNQKLFLFNLMVRKSQTCALHCSRLSATCPDFPGLPGLPFLLDPLKSPVAHRDLANLTKWAHELLIYHHTCLGVSCWRQSW